MEEHRWFDIDVVRYKRRGVYTLRDGEKLDVAVVKASQKIRIVDLSAQLTDFRIVALDDAFISAERSALETVLQHRSHGRCV